MTWTDYLFLIVTCLIGIVVCQEEFLDAIECYDCFDKAVNSTCADPTPEGEIWEPRIQLKTIPTVKCRKGACVKWTYYRNHELMIHRTCSQNIRLNVQYATVCRSEKFGNGALCMCADDLCNSAHNVRSAGGLLTMAIALTTFVVTHHLLPDLLNRVL